MKKIILQGQMHFMEQMTDENKDFHKQHVSLSICQAFLDHAAVDIRLHIDDLREK
jgi:hypothetical protein